jgi:hypothetical protein
MLPLARWLLIAALLTHCGTPNNDPHDPRTAVDAGARDASRPQIDASDPITGETMVHDAGKDARIEDAGVTDAWVELEFGPQLARNPHAASDGFATQHGDPGASDTSPLPGPGANVVSASLDLLAVCPSILPRKDGLLIAVCTQIANQTPAAFLIDPRQLQTLSSLQLVKGDLFGGVYPYLDERDRLVVVDGANDLLHVAAAGKTLTIADKVPLPLSADSVVGLTVDYQGQIWFASAKGVVGIVGAETIDLAEGIANSIAVAPEGVAVVTDHALYLLTGEDGTPQVKLRATYDRGSARKPGQLSWGSGSTPTFFGPRTGSEYLAITDNARPTMNLIVYRTDGDATPVCSISVPSPAGDGSENSPIGAGRSVFVTSTFAYPYLALPANAGPSVPDSAPLNGGMARIDVTRDEACQLVWTNRVRSAAVPKLSVADKLLYTIERKLSFGPNGSPFDSYAYTVIDPETGEPTVSTPLSNSADPMQLAGTLGPDSTFYQGTTTGILRIQPSP